MSSVGSIAALALILGLVGVVWVFVDASENSSRSAVLWGLVALIGGLLGVLIYVLVGRDEKSADDGTRPEPDRGTAKISHRCQTCGEKYYAPNSDIGTCRSCGGIKIDDLT